MTDKRKDSIEPEIRHTGFETGELREAEDEHLALAKLAEIFQSFHYVDLSRDYLRNWKNAEEYESTYGSIGHYSDAIEDYINNNVAERDRKRCLKLTDPENIREEFKKRSRFSVEMTDIKLGRERILVYDFIRISPDGNRFVMCSTDMTETLETEKKLHNDLKSALDDALKANQKNEILNSIIKPGPWTFYYDKNNKYTGIKLTPECCNVVGNEADTLEDMLKLIHPEDIGRVLLVYNACLNDPLCKTPYDIEYRMQTREGAYRWIHATGRKRQNQDGSAEVYGVCINIDDIVARRNKEDRLYHIQSFGDMINAALWSIDFNEENTAVKVVWTQEFRHMFGFSGETDFPNTIEAWSCRLHPEDRQQTLKHLEECAKSRDIGKFVYDLKYRILRKNGEYVWYRATGRMENIGGGIRRMYGVIFDISAEKQLETANSKLAETNQKLARRMALSDYFLKSFVSSYYANLKTGTIGVLYADEKVKNNLNGKIQTCAQTIDWCLNTLVYSEDRKKVAQAFSIENIRRELSKSSDFSIVFRKAAPRENEFVRCMIIRGEDDDHVAVGFKDITDEIRAEKEQENRLKKAEESRRFLENFAKRYDLAFRTNLNDGSFAILKSTEALNAAKFSFKNMQEAGDFLINNLVYPADRKMLMHEMDTETVRQRLKETPTYNVEFRLSIKGVELWNEMSVTSIGNDEIAVGFVEKDREITNKRILEIITKDSEGLYVVNLDTNIMKAFKATGLMADKPQIARYSDVMKKFGIGMTDDARKYFEAVSDCANCKDILQRNGKAEFVYLSPHFGGKPVWLKMESYVLTYRDGIPETMLVRSIKVDAMQRERLELNKQVAEQKEKLEKALDEAEAANKAKSAFLFSMSHDVRTPMNAILGFTNMALKHPEDKEKVIDSLEKTKQAGNLLLSLINSVLDMSRIESGNAKLEEIPSNVMHSYDKIESTMMELAKTKDIDLSFTFGKIKNRFVFADTDRCSRVLLNLIGNAVKYTKEGGYVKVFCEQTGMENGYGIYRYSVEDNGIGMSEEFQKHAFDEFAREETATVSGIQGTGLGLSVCKAFVNLMGGTIECQSKQGVGTTFTVTLPLKLQDEDKAEAREEEENLQNSLAFEAAPEHVFVDFTGKRVLLVEDNEMNREIAADILEDAGFIVESAEDGSVAVKLVKEKGPAYFDFILMDIQMPVMDGYAATKEIRKLDGAENLPIIAVSANAFAEDRKASLEAGMNDHIPKPIDVGILMKTIARFL
ncbi:MAG TPA: PAS domain-containing protein [Methanocorpusculum sp.]|nr:PAS domain-containing protein [Methanocorpusculum sp.]